MRYVFYQLEKKVRYSTNTFTYKITFSHYSSMAMAVAWGYQQNDFLYALY